jgi:hypothetical protein
LSKPLPAALIAAVLLAASCTERELAAAPARDAGDAGASAGDSREWTAGLVEQRREGLRPPPMLRDVRVGRNPGFDRVVFEFEGTRLPGYRLEYIDGPARRCGSGDEVRLLGQGLLQVRLEPARAHTEAGRETMTEREMKPGLPVLLELEQVCDFEGQVEWVLGTRGPHRYRVMELQAPTRLVVDVRH